MAGVKRCDLARVLIARMPALDHTALVPPILPSDEVAGDGQKSASATEPIRPGAAGSPRKTQILKVGLTSGRHVFRFSSDADAATD